ncbi:Olfactory receptor 2G3 [Amphibalanus amphitrite]|uniref:Olfactory receptor 2G3 n=1 Tax=Amphibalanus amphitrite TaxID=1232801 RepID=A0A6A4WLB6_AMPAM|nr:Olfactory receptor 2G3 [Amphibalanus amphitrite]
MGQLMERLGGVPSPTDLLDEDARSAVRTTLPWLEVLLCSLVALNSLLPVVAVLRYQHIRRHNMYIFLAGMATSDICVALSTLTAVALQQLVAAPPPALCVFISYVRLAANTASMLGLLALTGDRSAAVLRPLRHRVHMSAQRARRLAPLCWLAGGVQSALLALAQSQRLPPAGRCDAFSALHPAVLMVSTFSTDVIVLGIIGLNLTVICVSLHHRRRLLAGSQRSGKPPPRAARNVHLRSYVAVLKLVLLFLALVLPFQAALHWYLFAPGHCTAVVFVVTGVMRQVYHIFNGWVFGLWCAELRRAYLHILCRRPLSPSETSGSRVTVRRSEQASSGSDAESKAGRGSQLVANGAGQTLVPPPPPPALSQTPDLVPRPTPV